VLRLPATHIRSLICFASGVHAILLGSCLATCAPGRSESLSRPGSIVQPATRSAGLLARGRERDLPGFQAIHPVPLPRSTTPAEPMIPRLLTVSSILPPPFPRQRLQRFLNFGAQSRGFGTCCLRFMNDVATITCKARFRLAGLAFTGRALNPLDRYKRFQITVSSSFSGLILAQGKFHHDVSPSICGFATHLMLR
jgi:hypothetical protein